MAAWGYEKSSRAESISSSHSMLSVLEDKTRIPKRPCNILYILNCAHLVRASLNSLYIPHSVLPVIEIKGRSRISAAPITGKIK